MSRKLEEWRDAIELLVSFGEGTAHLDQLLEQVRPGRSRWLVMAAFRDWLFIDSLLESRMQRRPRPVALNLLRLALAECLHRDEAGRPPVVHHAVQTGKTMRLSKAELSFINAVLRTVLREGLPERPELARTHPDWMVRRWRRQFGEEGTRQLLEWNQQQPMYTIFSEEPPSYAEPTSWKDYYRIGPSRFAEALADLESGKVYAQDPFARIPVELLNPVAGEAVLDLCAAPGGKSRLLSRRLGESGRLVLVDRPGRRLERLRENVLRFPGKVEAVIGCPLEKLAKEAVSYGLSPASFDAVLIDVPCSNTGVMRKRPDVKIRLMETGPGRLAADQLALLCAAATWVRPGGRLVYSTCSLEPEENDQVIESFLSVRKGWQLGARQLSLPWECGHDGGGAFLLTTGA